MGGNGPELIDDEGLVVECQFRRNGPIFQMDVWEVYLEFTNIQANYKGDPDRIFEAYGDWLRARYNLEGLTYLGVAQIFKLVSDHIAEDKKKSDTTPESPTGSESTPPDGVDEKSSPGSTNSTASTQSGNSASATETSPPTDSATSSKPRPATKKRRKEPGPQSESVS